MYEPYTLDPYAVKFDDYYVTFNPLHNEFDYEGTKENITRLGQLDPILMLNGVCVDGRHRVRIAKDLGVTVRCVDIDPTMSQEDVIVLCNKNTMSGRDFDTTQKAIKALQLVNEYGMSVISAARLMKVDRRLVSYASSIKGFNRQDILDTLMDDKQHRVQLGNMERPSRSLELLAKFVKTIDEKPKLVVDDSERVQWKHDALIKTETGKAWFYEMKELIEAVGTTKVDELLVEMANMKFKIELTDV